MTTETPGCGSTTDARKRTQPDTDPIAAMTALIVAAEAKDGLIPASAARKAVGLPPRGRAARLTDTAAPEGCTCSTDPLDRMPLIDGGCPVHGRPAAPAAVEGVETVEWGVRCSAGIYAAGLEFDARLDLASDKHHNDCVGPRTLIRRTRVSYPDRVSEWSPVEPETSEPEGGESLVRHHVQHATDCGLMAGDRCDCK